MTNHPTTIGPPHEKQNGAVHVDCRTPKHVAASAAEAEAETRGIFRKCKTAQPIRQMLIDLGQPRPKKPIKTDNSTAYKVANHSSRRTMSKSWDMLFNWLRDTAVVKKVLHIWWEKAPKPRQIISLNTSHPKYIFRRDKSI